MKRPPTTTRGKQIVDVVVDPVICKHLREHQREGVKFMYECVMGLRSFEGQGAVLADEMGLGKTLQAIALLWTLLKQNPNYGDPPVVKKAVVVCPVTLTDNWRKEFRKWLGNERIGVFVVDNKNKNVRLTDFTMGKAYNVLIIGYEKFRKVYEELDKGAGIDIIIADEGHRLKTATNQALKAIKALNTDRRIVLTGTPLQNDMSEYFAGVDLVNPGLLGKYNTFKREFEGPIDRSRQPEASAKDIEKGKDRQAELSEITGQFMLRRTADLLAQYLPPKTEYVVFCRPTAAQASVYRTILGSSVYGTALNSPQMSLSLITTLKKLCNSPNLLNSASRDSKQPNEALQGLFNELPPHLLKSAGASAKLRVLDSLLHEVRMKTDEKVVLVSHYTSTLDMLGTLLTSLGYPFLRVDGDTAQSKRQGLIDKFNKTPSSTCFAFLLSAKSGGTGINLIGASRLVLFDADWNPAHDAQAMARIHRDGQKRPCWIYRLVLQGALDEKIFQRQVTKTGLADEIVDGKASVAGFSRDELRDIFSLDDREECQTHELLSCPCGSDGVIVTPEDDSNDKDDEGNDGDSSDIEDIGWRPASQVDMEKQKQENAPGCKGPQKGKMQALMQYAHLAVPRKLDDEALERVEDVLDDGIIVDLLKADQGRVGFVMARNVSRGAPIADLGL